MLERGICPIAVLYFAVIRSFFNIYKLCWSTKMVKMVNGFRYYRAQERVSIASALSTALTIYPCQIRVHQR